MKYTSIRPLEVVHLTLLDILEKEMLPTVRLIKSLPQKEASSLSQCWTR